jgi:hypothetical protein
MLGLIRLFALPGRGRTTCCYTQHVCCVLTSQHHVTVATSNICRPASAASPAHDALAQPVLFVPPQVAALLQQLQEQEERAPGSKAVVFSSWPRVLGLVAEALTAHSVEHASLAASSLGDRQESIKR